MNRHKNEPTSIAVCVVTNGNEIESRFFFESLIPTLTTNCALSIYDLGSEKSLRNYCAQCAILNNGRYRYLPEMGNNLASIYNYIISDCDEDYIAIVPINAIMEANWVNELLCQGETLTNCNAGVIGIRSSGVELELSNTSFYNTFSQSDEMAPVWMGKLNIIQLPILFKRSIVQEIGGFDESYKDPAFVVDDFSFKAASYGYINFYATNTICIKPFIENRVLLPHKSKAGLAEFKTKINTFVKSINTV